MVFMNAPIVEQNQYSFLKSILGVDKSMPTTVARAGLQIFYKEIYLLIKVCDNRLEIHSVETARFSNSSW